MKKREKSKQLSMERETLNIHYLRLSPKAKPPHRAHEGDAGADLCAVGDTILRPGGRALISTGLAVAIPYGYEGQIRPRSGLAAKHGITVLNTPGTIDHGYTGEVKVCLLNTSRDKYLINQGDRIAQLVIAPIALPTFTEVNTLDSTQRGEGGFGSTGSSTAWMTHASTATS